MSNTRCVKTYVWIKEDQFNVHRIDKRIDTVQNLVKIYGQSVPEHLEKMAQKIYGQMDEIAKHAKK